MKSEEFEKSKAELEAEIEKNEKQIKINHEKTRILNANNLNNKCETTLSLSAFGLLLLVAITGAFTKIFGLSAVASVFPGVTYQFALLGGSLGIGVLARKLIDKKIKSKERLEKISSAKTYTEKLEEEIRYEIETEKAHNKNLVIEGALSALDYNQQTINNLSKKYDLSDRTAPQTKEEAEKRYKEISEILNEQYDKLDILTIQKVLHERFWKIRSKDQSNFEKIIYSLMGGTFTLFVALLTYPLTKAALTGTLLNALMIFGSPIIIGSVGTAVYMTKRNRIYREVFNKLNAELGENALDYDFGKKFDGALEEQDKIDTALEEQIRRVASVQAQLQESNRHLEAFTTVDDSKVDALSQDYSPQHITQSTNQAIIEYPKLDEDLSRTLSSDEEKGPRLVKRRIPPKK